jgi:tetratricopeptide (TPR) repeat protein
LRASRSFPLIALLLGLSGCGDPGLWDRWRAERAFWHAQREVERILVRPQVAKPSDFARAEAGYRAIVVTFPASRWARAAAAGTTAEVAMIAGRSAIALARLEEVQSRLPEALADYERAEREWAGFPELAIEAAVHRADALARVDSSASTVAWEHVARAFPAIDPATGAPLHEHLQAVRHLTDELEAHGRLAARDSLLTAEEAVAESWLAMHPGAAAGTAWLDVAIESRARRGDRFGALASARRALTAGFHLTSAERERRILDLGERCLSFDRPDSALPYARWAVGEFAGSSHLRALDLEARVFHAAGKRDSAIVVYGRILGENERRQDVAVEARFQRAVLLEEAGRWPLARAEYSALCAAAPTHARALESWERVVRHHRAAGEVDLARIETEHALAALDQLVTMQNDVAVRTRTREARVAVLLAAGRTREGIRDLQEVWANAGLTPVGAALGEIAAREAEAALHDPTLARSLWQILARSSPDRELQGRANAALARLAS